MSQTYAQQMKNAIIADLQTLVPNVLNSVIADDMTKISPLDRNWPGFPSAVVIPPTVTTSDYEEWRTNNREYTWYIMVVTTPDNLPQNDPTYLESLIDNVLGVFDADCTLQGTSNAGVMPAVLEPPGPVSSNAVTYVIFSIQLKARTVVTAGVQ